jgi:hypothetical protein
MAENSFYNLSHKPSVSTNDKADIIAARLRELKIAYRIMLGHPDVLLEFKNAVKSGTAIPSAPEESNHVIPFNNI